MNDVGSNEPAGKVAGTVAAVGWESGSAGAWCWAMAASRVAGKRYVVVVSAVAVLEVVAVVAAVVVAAVVVVVVGVLQARIKARTKKMIRSQAISARQDSMRMVRSFMWVVKLTF